jgi:hypothetical protein
VQQALPRPLSYFIDILAHTKNPVDLAALLDRTYALFSPPAAQKVLALCDVFWRELNPALREQTAAEVLYDDMITLLLDGEGFGFRCVFILVDGVDGFPATARDPAAAARTVVSLLAQVKAWADRRVYIKAFVPTGTLHALAAFLPDLEAQTRRITLHWSPELLAELLRRRVYVATRGRWDSLDGIASPALHDIEATVARAATPLPREALLVVRQMLRRAELRNGERLEQVDIRTALQWYDAHQRRFSSN